MAKKLKSKIKKGIKKSSKPKRKSSAKKKTTRKISSTKKISKKILAPSETKNMTLIGEITHYFPKVKAGVIVLKDGTLAVGDSIFIKGHTTKFKEKVSSLQINHVVVNEIKKGDEAGILVKSRVRIGDSVYKI